MGGCSIEEVALAAVLCHSYCRRATTMTMTLYCGVWPEVVTHPPNPELLYYGVSDEVCDPHLKFSTLRGEYSHVDDMPP